MAGLGGTDTNACMHHHIIMPFSWTLLHFVSDPSMMLLQSLHLLLPVCKSLILFLGEYIYIWPYACVWLEQTKCTLTVRWPLELYRRRHFHYLVLSNTCKIYQSLRQLGSTTPLYLRHCTLQSAGHVVMQVI